MQKYICHKNGCNDKWCIIPLHRLSELLEALIFFGKTHLNIYISEESHCKLKIHVNLLNLHHNTTFGFDAE